MSNRQIPSAAPRRIVDLPPSTAAARDRQPSASPVKPTETELRVGRNISLKGDIGDCAVLTVEGTVEAAFRGRLIQVTEHGRLAGSCEVEAAEIRGRFEGELTVTKLLRVHERGRVKGKIRYARLEVVGGGTIAGQIETLDSAAKPNVIRGPAAANNAR